MIKFHTLIIHPGTPEGGGSKAQQLYGKRQSKIGKMNRKITDQVKASDGQCALLPISLESFSA